MSCGVGHRHGSILVLLWLWCRPAAQLQLDTQPGKFHMPGSAPFQKKSWVILYHVRCTILENKRHKLFELGGQYRNYNFLCWSLSHLGRVVLWLRKWALESDRLAFDLFFALYFVTFSKAHDPSKLQFPHCGIYRVNFHRWS